MVHVVRMVSVLFVVHVPPVLLVPPVTPIVPVVTVTAVLPLVLGGVRHVVLQVLVPSPCCPARRRLHTPWGYLPSLIGPHSSHRAPAVLRWFA
ncbi:hypothetical protein [Streptomyces sp. TLI_053]|uniref:hypothetical protein n=1 Tax=Streptomyces sp. TLI_053 TaxID=1855352 RepID=UPI0013520743|nr:hypothetical protein [Streptomyces sp. TLI_053]